MPTLTVFDPAMCCPTGVCGVNIDPKLTQLAADLASLKEQGVQVTRFNLKDHAQAFTEHPAVLEQMGAEAEHLPIFMVDGQVVSRGAYPGIAQLKSWTGVAATAPSSSSKSSCCSPSSGCC